MGELTAQRLRDILDYDPSNGSFTWKQRPGGYARAGKAAGSFNGRGYQQIWIGNKNYRACRLAWMHFYGSLPKGVIDHINGNPSDDRIENLRDVSQRENQQNRSEARAGKLPGAFLKKGAYRRKRWASIIRIDGKNKHLGYFETEQEAHETYMKACDRIAHV